MSFIHAWSFHIQSIFFCNKYAYVTTLTREIGYYLTGARFVENCALKKVETCRKRNMVTSVVTSHGEVKCDYFINAAGQVRLLHLDIKI